jgi:hypothetical protein
MIGSALVSLGEAHQLALRIGQAAFVRDLAKPSCKFPVMRAAIPQPPFPIGRDLLQRRRAFI